MEGEGVLHGFGGGLLNRVVGGDEPVLELVPKVGALVESDGVLAFELELVELADRRPVGDLLVHQGLGEGRFVALVVAVPAIADDVDDDVTVELVGGT